MHASSGLFSWNIELLVFASRQIAPKIVDLSVRFIRILFYSCQRAQRAAEAARGAKHRVSKYIPRRSVLGPGMAK